MTPSRSPVDTLASELESLIRAKPRSYTALARFVLAKVEAARAEERERGREEGRAFMCATLTEWQRVLRHQVHEQWAACGNSDPRLKALSESVDSAFIGIRKSNLLWRMVHCGERPRTQQCPKHKGRWHGLPSPGNECECGLTGWLPIRAAADRSAVEAERG